MQAADGTVLSGVETGRDGTLSASVSEAGTYYVKVTDDYYHDSGQYNITLTEATYDSNYERENNGYGGSGTRLTSSQKMSGQLFSSSDVDFFNITADQAGTLTVQFDAPTDSYSDYFKVTLQDSSFNTLSAIETGKDAEISAAVESAGTYWVKIEDDYYHDDGVYSVTASLSNQTGNVETEDNGYFTTADEILNGTAISGQLSNENDWDVFAITFDETVSATLSFDAPTDSGLNYYFIGVYDQNYDLVDYRFTGTDTTFQSDAVPSGRYYAAVTSDEYLSSEAYSILVNAAPYVSANSESEDNGSFETADRITLDTQISANLSSATDVDFFRLAAPGYGALEVTFDAASEQAEKNYYLAIYNDNFELLTAKTFGGDTSVSAGLSEAGATYVGIYSGSVFTNETYSISVSHTDDESTGFETEVNDYFSTADAIFSGTSIVGQLSSLADWDLYQVAISEAGSIAFQFDPGTDSEASYYYLSIYDENYERIDWDNTGRDMTLSYDVFDTGTYYFAITSDTYYSQKQYSFSYDFTAAPSATNEISGTIGTDTLDGTSGNDLFSYLGGNDLIYAGAGEDTFSIIGTSGNEFSLATIRNITALNAENSSRYGSPHVRLMDVELVKRGSLETSILSNSAEKFTKAEVIFGSALDDSLVGTSLDETFDPIAGNDRIDGGAGDDTLLVFQKLSSLGISELNNIYRVSDKADNQLLKVTNVEQLLGLDGSINLSAEVSENTVILSKANDVVSGTSSADIIDGAGGNDIIDGYLGDDTAIFFTSIDEAKITINRVSGSADVEYEATNNSEYAFTKTTLKSIETIKFLDGQIEVDLDDVYKTETSSKVLSENSDPVTVTVSLLSEPTAAVTLRLTGSEISLSAEEIVFSTENWNSPQSVNCRCN
jgi:DUF971 family protein